MESRSAAAGSPSRAEGAAGPLPAAELEAYAGPALARLVDHLAAWSAGEGKPVDLRTPGALSAELDVPGWMERGGMDPEALCTWLDRYLDAATKLHHPGFLGHQVAAPFAVSAVADLINGATNNGMAVYEMGPPAVVLEQAALDWMLSHVGWQAGGGGVLVHGGSLANLTALLAARAAAAPQAWRDGVGECLAILAPASAHYSVERAAGILGLGTDAVEAVPTDSAGRLLTEELPAAAQRVAARGRKVMAVVANACSTATGLYDPLEAVADFCEDGGYWFHVDGAHGASLLLDEGRRSLLRGVERADSLVWDAHKMLHTSALCAAVLVREDRRLPDAFRQQASYLGNPGHEVGPDLFGRAIECTKAPLGLKLFLNLAVHGEAGIIARNSRLHELAADFAALVRARPEFESPFPVESNILLFRLRDDAVDHRLLRQKLIQSGEDYLTAAQLDGRLWLRFTVMNPRSDAVRVAALLDRAVALAADCRG